MLSVFIENQKSVTTNKILRQKCSFPFTFLGKFIIYIVIIFLLKRGFMLNNFFSRFMPKDDGYFTLLSEMVDAVCITAELTQKCTRAATQEDIVSLFSQIKEQQQRGRKLQGKILRELHKSFITPFDREDINYLTLYMRDVIDHISSCAKRIVRYNPKEMPEAVTTMADILNEAVQVMKTLITKLPEIKNKPQNLTHLCNQIESLENKSDEVYENYLIDLFKNETDVMEIIKLKDIIAALEHAMDSTEAVSKVISTIIVKYA